MEEQKELTNISNMSDKDLFVKIIHLSAQPSISRKALLEILEAARKFAPRPDES